LFFEASFFLVIGTLNGFTGEVHMFSGTFLGFTGDSGILINRFPSFTGISSLNARLGACPR